jgi:hypothetical protein
MSRESYLKEQRSREIEHELIVAAACVIDAVKTARAMHTPQQFTDFMGYDILDRLARYDACCKAWEQDIGDGLAALPDTMPFDNNTTKGESNNG